MKLITSLLALSICYFGGFAQKAPDIQNINSAAPKLVRIDGKLNEWDNPLVADNKRTEVQYTLANDDKNLYLALKSTSAVAKIMAGGISFTVNNRGKKKEEGGFTVTYPVITRAGNNRGAGQMQNRQRGMQQGVENQSQQQRDSLVTSQRKTQLVGVKEIKILGFAGIPDSLISIYNEYGIKAKATIDDKGEYLYELAIPMTLLNISMSSTKEVTYQIKINGRVMGGSGGMMMRTAGSGGGFSGNRGGFGGGNEQDLLSPTDFWGKYPLQNNK